MSLNTPDLPERRNIYMKHAHCLLVLILALTAAFLPAQAMENSLCNLVNSQYSGSYIDFMISNFGYAMVIPAEPEICIYRFTRPDHNEIVCTVSDRDAVLVALAYCEQGGVCWASIFDPDTGDLLGFARETDLEILQIH